MHGGIFGQLPLSLRCTADACRNRLTWERDQRSQEASVGDDRLPRKLTAVLCADVECSPCSLHGEKRCRKKSRFCMDLIDPGMVLEATENLLRQDKSDRKEA